MSGKRDHWPDTSAMIIGNAINGGRSLGACENFSGGGFDPITGMLTPDSLGLSSADFGATLLTLADIDSRRLLPNARPFDGLLL